METDEDENQELERVNVNDLPGFIRSSVKPLPTTEGYTTGECNMVTASYISTCYRVGKTNKILFVRQMFDHFQSTPWCIGQSLEQFLDVCHQLLGGQCIVNGTGDTVGFRILRVQQQPQQQPQQPQQEQPMDIDSTCGLTNLSPDVKAVENAPIVIVKNDRRKNPCKGNSQRETALKNIKAGVGIEGTEIRDSLDKIEFEHCLQAPGPSDENGQRKCEGLRVSGILNDKQIIGEAVVNDADETDFHIEEQTVTEVDLISDNMEIEHCTVPGPSTYVEALGDQDRDRVVAVKENNQSIEKDNTIKGKKRKLCQHEKEANRAIENMIRTFWLQNYDLDSDHALDSSDAYDHFISLSKQIKPTITFEQFKTSSGRIADLRTRALTLHRKVYLAYPSNQLTLEFHQKKMFTEEQENPNVRVCDSEREGETTRINCEATTPIEDIGKFLKEHYIIPNDDSMQCRLEPKEVYLLYKQCHNNTDNVNFDLFKTLIGKMGAPLVGVERFKKYRMAAASRIAQAWHAREERTGQHPTSTSQNTSITSCNIHVLNTQGAVTNRKNKSKLLRVKCDKGGNNIIALTETWLYEDKHYNEEITKEFKDYSIARSDRDIQKKSNATSTTNEEKDKLQSGGGCLLLASPGLTLLPVGKVSNGVCELLICEVPQLNMAAAVVYNPPKPNFSLPKFKEVINKIEHYLQENSKKGEKQLDVTLMGDFNFPPGILKWEKSQQGLYPVVKPGKTDDQKEACRLLIDLVNEYSLFQIVDKPTRNNNILDLIFTDNPDAMSSIRTASMKPHSDHRLISTKITTYSIAQQNPPPSSTIT